MLAIIAAFLVGVTATLLHYVDMSARTRTAVNLVSARTIVEDVIRNTTVGKDEDRYVILNNRIAAFKDEPGFENIIINNNEDLQGTEMDFGQIVVIKFEVPIKDELLGREERFYVYKQLR